MADDPPTVRKKPSRLDLLIVAVIATLITGVSIALAVRAYMETPYVANFRGFAEPTSTKVEAKSVYLFGPILFEVFGLGLILKTLASRSDFEYTTKYVWTRGTEPYLLILFFLVGLLITAVNASHALDAARHLSTPMQRSGASWTPPAHSDRPPSE